MSYNEIPAVTSAAFSQGEKKGKIDIAKTMLAEGFDPDSIARITQLTLKEIHVLKANGQDSDGTFLTS